MSIEKHKFNVNKLSEGARLDIFLAEKTGMSRSLLQKLITNGDVLVDGSIVHKSHHTRAGETVTLTVPEPEKLGVEPQDIPLNVIYEDDDLAVISKPAGMVTHPAPGHRKDTLVNALLARLEGLSSIGGVERPGIVHRLDRDTSGLMMVAKNDLAHKGLSEQLKARKIEKTYWALVRGKFTEDTGEIREPVGRHKKKRQKMSVSIDKGRQAVTRWSVLERFDGLTLLELKPETGRTHQLRVHLSHIRRPVVGDSQYGSDKKKDRSLGVTRQLLHAKRVKFEHPRGGRVIEFDDELPEDFVEILKVLRK